MLLSNLSCADGISSLHSSVGFRVLTYPLCVDWQCDQEMNT